LFLLWMYMLLRQVSCFSPQIAFYEQVKQILISTGFFRDNIVTHLASSIVAVSISH